MMKNIATLAVIGLFILLCAALPQDANAQFSISQPRNSFSQTSNSNQQNKANITFKNSSDYTMTIRVLYLAGGLYSVVELPAHSSRTLYFNSSNTFKMKILASKGNEKSYHDGGELSVTCTLSNGQRAKSRSNSPHTETASDPASPHRISGRTISTAHADLALEYLPAKEMS